MNLTCRIIKRAWERNRELVADANVSERMIKWLTRRGVYSKGWALRKRNDASFSRNGG